MGRKSTGDTKCLDLPSFMQNDTGVPKAGKGLQVKAFSTGGKFNSSFRVDKNGRKSDLPILNLAKVRRHLIEQTELAGNLENGIGAPGKEGELKSVGISHSLCIRHTTVEGRERKSSVANSMSDKILTHAAVNGFAHGSNETSESGELASGPITVRSKGEYKNENTSNLINGNFYSRDKVLKHPTNGLQTSFPVHLSTPPGAVQASRRHKSENASRNGPLTCRIVSNPNAEIGEARTNECGSDLDVKDDIGSAWENRRLSLGPSVNERISQGGLKQENGTGETKKPRQLNSGTSSRDSTITVPGTKSLGSTVRKVATSHGYRAARLLSNLDRAQLEDKFRHKLTTVRQLALHPDLPSTGSCRRGNEEAHVEVAAASEINMSVKDEFDSGHVSNGKGKAPKLNLSGCQTSVPIGFGGNPVENIQTCRTSRPAVAEGSPRLALTDRGASRKSSLSSPYRKHEDLALNLSLNLLQNTHKSDAPTLPSSSPSAPATPEMVLRQCGGHMTDYERREILPYSEIYYLGLNANKIQATGIPGSCNHGFDDERGDYNVVEHDHLAYRYEVLGILGKGSFGEVLKCMDHKHKALRAVKMIRNKRRFHQQALVEVKILEDLRQKAQDEPSNFNIVTIYESFYFRGHLCIAFALHDISLYELIKRNNFQGISLIVIKSFASQLLATLRFLRKLHVIHCDLKPENILLQHPAMSKIKVIDFGSSCFCHERIYTYIQSRFYRSPEVILGLSYDMMIDIWSLGCILAELFTGYPLFPGENEVEQLACMMEILGLPPASVMEQATRKKMFFDSQNNPRIVPNSRGKKHWPGSKDLATAIGCNDPLFVSFLEGCLRWDKNQRLTPEQLMQHPWMVGPASTLTPRRSPLRPSNQDTSKRRSLKTSETPHRSYKHSKQNTPAVGKAHLSKQISYSAVKMFQGADFSSLLPPIGEETAKDYPDKKRAI